MKPKLSPFADDLSIVEAIETLSSIATLELDSPIAVAEEHEVTVQDVPITYKSVHWLHKKNAPQVMLVVKETFRVILDYLKNFYKRQASKQLSRELLEGIKTIMSLVGEAAKKLDRFSSYVEGSHTSIKETKEFRELISFYKRKIAPISREESMTKLTLLPMKAVVAETKKERMPLRIKARNAPLLQHAFIDLEAVKNDTDHELFLIRKEDGSRFFNPRLLRSVKLVSNFEEYINDEERVDIHADLRACQDDEARLVARNILKKNWKEVDDFVKAAHRFVDHDLAMLLYRSILALLLSAQDVVERIAPKKSASAYFNDFQKFLRVLVSSHDYQKMMAYPQKSETTLSYKICHLTQEFIRALFDSDNIDKSVITFVDSLIEKGRQVIPQEEVELHLKKPPLSYKLTRDYEALVEAAKPYSHMPLAKVLEALRDPDISGYDPLLLQNIPAHLFTLEYPQHDISFLRIATPTGQDYIHKAAVAEEFKGFLRSIGQDKPAKKHLIFNLQDRTSWREFARANALEELQKNEEFKHQLVTVTETKDSDFYQQRGPYEELNQADMFIEHLLEHAKDESSGYYYPEKVHKALFPHFAKALAKNIHELFFASRNVLTRSSRMDFIELFYLFLELKVIELVAPSSISFTCKDALDIAMPATCELFFLLKLVNDRPISHEEEDYMKVLLFGLPLIRRGRNLFSDRFTRMNSMLKVVEATIEEQGKKEFMHNFYASIGKLYDSKILAATLKI